MANQLKDRWNSSTPSWFKKIIGVCATLAAVGIGLLSAESQVPGFVLPHKLELIAQWFVVAGIVGGIIAKTAKESE